MIKKTILFLIPLSFLIIAIIIFCNKPHYGYFKQVGNLNEARYRHESFLMDDGKVLIVGGYSFSKEKITLPSGPPTENVNSIEVFDPETNNFKLIFKDEKLFKFGHHQIFKLLNDKILFFSNVNEIAIYDYKSNKLQIIGHANIPRNNYRYLPLENGKVLIYSGYKNDQKEKRLNTIGLFDLEKNKFKIIDQNNLFSKNILIFSLPDNKVFIIDDKQGFIYDLRLKKLGNAFNIEIPKGFMPDLTFNKMLSNYHIVYIKQKNERDLWSIYGLYNLLNNKFTLLGQNINKGVSCKVINLSESEYLFSSCVCNSGFLRKTCKNAELFDKKTNQFITINDQKKGTEGSLVHTSSNKVLLTGGLTDYFQGPLGKRIKYKILNEAKVFIFNSNN